MRSLTEIARQSPAGAWNASVKRRMVLNTTKSLVLFVAAALGFAAPAVAAPLAVRLLVAASAVGDSPRAKASNDRKEVEGLLIRARQALKDGDLEMAESVMARAEKLKVEYSVFHLGDTPRKARADLEAAKRKTKKNRFQRPSEKFAPEVPNSTSPPAADTDRLPPIEKGRVPAEVGGPLDESPLAMPNSEGKLKQAPIPQRAMRGPGEELDRAPRGCRRPRSNTACRRPPRSPPRASRPPRLQPMASSGPKAIATCWPRGGPWPSAT